MAPRASARARPRPIWRTIIYKASQNNDPKGWSDIQQGEHLTKLANMVVLDRLKKFDKDNGASDHDNHCKNLRRH